MPRLASQRLRQEVDLMERFTQSYRRKIAALIERLNGSPAAAAAGPQPSDLQCLRLCVEAVDMMLASQTQVAQSLREIAESSAPRKVA